MPVRGSPCTTHTPRPWRWADPRRGTVGSLSATTSMTLPTLQRPSPSPSAPRDPEQIHDDLDAAVFDAYGWPQTLTDEEILERLVALNQERVEEEMRSLVRWLRPEFQNPQGTKAATQCMGSGGAGGKAPREPRRGGCGARNHGCARRQEDVGFAAVRRERIVEAAAVYRTVPTYGLGFGGWTRNPRGSVTQRQGSSSKLKHVR